MKCNICIDTCVPCHVLHPRHSSFNHLTHQHSITTIYRLLPLKNLMPKMIMVKLLTK